MSESLLIESKTDTKKLLTLIGNMPRKMNLRPLRPQIPGLSLPFVWTSGLLTANGSTRLSNDSMIQLSVIKLSLWLRAFDKLRGSTTMTLLLYDHVDHCALPPCHYNCLQSVSQSTGHQDEFSSWRPQRKNLRNASSSSSAYYALFTCRGGKSCTTLLVYVGEVNLSQYRRLVGCLIYLSPLDPTSHIRYMFSI